MSKADAALVALGGVLELQCRICGSCTLVCKTTPRQATLFCVSCETLYKASYASAENLHKLHQAQRAEWDKTR